MGDADKNGWPDIESLPPLPVPAPPVQAPPGAQGPPATRPPAAPPPPPPPPGSPYPPTSSRRSVGSALDPKAWWITGGVAAAVLLIAVVAIAVASGSNDEPSPPPTTSAVAAPSSASGEDATTTTTNAPTPTTAPPPPATAPPPPGFEDGTYLVGQDIQPGVYMTSGGSACYWERRSGLDNGFDGLLANGGGGPAVVEIVGSDLALMSRGCGRWTDYAAPAEPATSFGDGDWVVGEQIAAGTYRVESPWAVCSWQRATGFTHDFDEVIDYDVEVAAGDTVRLTAGELFTSDLCGAWVPA